jgi:hypothetical protein
MSRPFSAPAADEVAVAAVEPGIIRSPINYGDVPGTVRTGIGDAMFSSATPFARFVSKSSFPVTGLGAITVASAVCDTTTYGSSSLGPVPSDWPVDDR